MSENIYDSRRLRIGKIVTNADGSQEIFDAKGFRLGKYNKREDKTYDKNGRSFGFSNQLLRFLK